MTRVRTNRLISLVLLLICLFGGVANAAETLRIGYQKYGTLLLLKERGLLEQTLGPKGVEIRWTEFPGGPQLLEALNIGSIDYGITGEAPPIFAQAAGAPLVYLAYEPAAPTGEAILVPKDSKIANLAELKGKRVALNKGSNVHYLLVRALQSVGLTFNDITPVYLAPADGRAAFERGAVDAWAIWDPYYAAGVAGTDARILADGTGLVKNHQFFLATRSFAMAHPDIIHALQDGLSEIDAWGRAHADDIATQISPKVGIPVPILQVATRRLGYGIKPIDGAVLAEQQQIADSFFALGLIPKPIIVTDATLAPGDKVSQ
jgi:sulfonate transport system substrate-binding protein